MKLPTLSEISSYSFGANLFFSNLMRIPVLGPILRIPVGVLWLIGFGTWYLGSLIDGKPHPHKAEGWYTFAEFKTQNEISALLGTIAAILLLAVPELLVPIAWLFAISNVFWAIAAHHESKVLHPDNDDYSTDKQTVYTYLTIVVTSLSLITAIVGTLTLLFPLTAPVLLPVLTGIGVVLTCVSLGIGIALYFRTYQTDKEKREQLQANINVEEPSPRTDVSNAPEKTCCSDACHIVFGSPIQSQAESPTHDAIPPSATALAR